jgi:hypothetical protein
MVDAIVILTPCPLQQGDDDALFAILGAWGPLRERWIVGGEVSDSALDGLLRREWLARPRSGSGNPG